MKNFIGAVALLVLLAGCAGLGGESQVYQAYNGPVKPVSQVASLEVPISIELVAIDDIKVSLPILGTGSKIFHLEPGSHKISFKYDVLWQLSGDEHDVVVSDVYTLAYDFSAGNKYMLAHKSVTSYEKALEFKDLFDAWMIDPASNTKINAVKDSYTNQSSLLGNLFGSANQSVMANDSGAAPQQLKLASLPSSDISPDVAGEAVSNDKPIVNKVVGENALQQLMLWWEKATPDERQAFHKWLYNK